MSRIRYKPCMGLYQQRKFRFSILSMVKMIKTKLILTSTSGVMSISALLLEVFLVQSQCSAHCFVEVSYGGDGAGKWSETLRSINQEYARSK